MRTSADIRSTVDYLTDASTRRHHRLPLRDGTACAHCASSRVTKWGRFRGRQRYRCTSCERTFSTFTGTPLWHLKRVDLWRTFLWAMDGRASVRLSARVIGVHKDTTFRWRHRLLTFWRAVDEVMLQGRVTVGGLAFPYSAKGSRRGSEQARRRGFRRYERPSRDRIVTVLAARDPTGPTLMEVLGRRMVSVVDYEERLRPRLRPPTVVVGIRGQMCPLAGFARRVGARYLQDTRPRGYLPGELYGLRSRIIDWLRPFRGVATRYLANYLQWFREDVGARKRRAARGGLLVPPAPD